MQATEAQARRKIQHTATCRLSPERLFDLLANPGERQKWDLCPSYITLEPLAAAPGPALEGARYTARGTARGIPFIGKTFVTAAERPRRYQTRSETQFARYYPSAAAIEEYLIEPEGTGSRVHYTMTLLKTPADGAVLTRLITSLLEPLLGGSAAKRNFLNTLRYAEQHAGVTA
jgi:Polyketide cyclase / dehydrase and lipid transport